MSKRKILARCVSGLVCAGLLFSLYPFLESLKPSSAIEKPLKVNILSIPKGKVRVFEHEGRPLAVYRPTEEYAKDLIANNKLTNGPYYKEGAVPEFFAYYRQSTYKGCFLYESKEYSPFKNEVPLQGLFDPCHMGFWDYSGRFINGVNMPKGVVLKNLEVVGSYQSKGEGIVQFPKITYTK
ncbi:hypothetical protein BTJ40_13165 [Microbulbifer sp. A4B17]|uniref:hypothetical protein n=1 Tax=Microbulbifer sp. A4B17 TaxID=359370 RepID=UPI000D52EF5E|nr:hypothetical protein [Microbulbifer sp. A4B17]AWF81700.1 hypothetical protein BTJ40_13165 [Microbulbifer sp. A4B17]